MSFLFVFDHHRNFRICVSERNPGSSPWKHGAKLPQTVWRWAEKNEECRSWDRCGSTNGCECIASSACRSQFDELCRKWGQQFFLSCSNVFHAVHSEIITQTYEGTRVLCQWQWISAVSDSRFVASLCFYQTMNSESNTTKLFMQLWI